ncbi:hypothetical protein [Mesorhizobium argentiipisi]|uniref:Uncharacterized protein n=1 Tax=Mesorhizobium argentiipisi TaxID=3015175 RepID=A0ABU8KN31_9HYPH
MRSEKSQNVKPEDGKAAVAAESLSRLASVGLQYGFFIGCLDPVDDKIRTAIMLRVLRVKRRESGDERGKNLAGEPIGASANWGAKRQIGPEPWIATTLDSFSRFDSTGFSQAAFVSDSFAQVSGPQHAARTGSRQRTTVPG